MIPRTELCDNLISLKLGNSYMMGYPIQLKNDAYERTKFQFNFCILIKEEEYNSNLYIYELLLKKIAKTFESIEVSYSLLKIDSGYDYMKPNREIINTFLNKLYQSILNKEETIFININNCNQALNRYSFFFKFIDFSKAKNEILPYHVPVWLKLIDENDSQYYENSVKSVIEEIDGLTHVKKIANKLDIDIKFVTYVLYNLSLVNSIAFVDIFQFTNIYRATKNLKDFYKEEFVEEFFNFCEINLNQFSNKHKYKPIIDVYNEEEEICDFNKINSSVLFSLYCELTNSQNVSDFLLKVKSFGINIPLFIAFGIYKKIIRKVHIYAYIRNKEKDQGNSM
jgi:hypothetical protein